MWPLYLGYLEIRQASHLQQPSAWKHRTITFMSDQHIPSPQQKSFLHCPLQTNFPFISPFTSLILYLLLIFPSSFPTLPGSVYLLPVVFPLFLNGLFSWHGWKQKRCVFFSLSLIPLLASFKWIRIQVHCCLLVKAELYQFDYMFRAWQFNYWVTLHEMDSFLKVGLCFSHKMSQCKF